MRQRLNQAVQALLWLVGLWCVVNYALRPDMEYGRMLALTGQVSVAMLVLALGASAPALRRSLPQLLRSRRTLGLGMFGFAVLHTGVYLHRKGVEGSLEPELLTGWIALALAVPLAITSTDRAVRRMGPRWRKLHAWSWAVAILSLLHAALTAYDPLLWWGALTVLMVVRLLRRILRRNS